MGTWQWNDQEKPTTTVGVRATAGAVTMKDDPQAVQRPYVFVRGYDSRLHVNWWDGKAWHWSDQGTPAGRTVIEKVGAITVQDNPSAQQRPYAFVITDDSKLHVNWWDGSKWHWSDQGAPPNHTISRPLGVTTMKDNANAFTRPYAFVITEDSRVWVNWWDGTKWNWSDQGAPSGQQVKKGVGVVSVQNDPNAVQRPYAFVQGYDSKLYVNWWDGTKWSWSDQGAPSGRLILDSVGVITMKDDPNAFTRPYVFVITDDSKLHVNWWDGKAWQWSAQNTPPGRVIERPGEALTMQDNPNATQRPYAFVITDDSDLWVNWWSLP